jgi:SAM-dependent methyltransferase
MKIFDRKRWWYLLQGVSRRFHQSKRCPCCGNSKSKTVDRKFFHTLEKCLHCGILFRFPRDSAAELEQFYEWDYAEPGLTTELPTAAQLQALIEAGFKGSPKDFSKIILLFQAIGLKRGDLILDYGANWGYGTWQFNQAGFAATGFELSKSRAKFGANLGIDILTDATQIAGAFHAVYSAHVLEHVANPATVLRQQLAWTRPGGYVVAHTPNGSRAWRVSGRKQFHLSWGRVHPVLLTEEFIVREFCDFPFFVSSSDDPADLQTWDRHSQRVGPLSGSCLFFVIRNSKSVQPEQKRKLRHGEAYFD